MNNVEVMQKLFEGDKYVELSGITITEVTAERAVVRAEIGAQHLNANGCVQGGMLYTLADFAFAVLENFLHPITVTQSGNITYIAAAVTSFVTATATETVRHGHNTVCQVVVRDDKDRIVCSANFNGFVKDAQPKQN